ncbi:hypothetical protein ASZ90_006674 [hydrocarbon metagenome]|uniref:Uncharacterized protein n=1 Tax=hydrocarbon metagenome TaxID=938273 RepID=A0A0W8FRJ1_9ZZZZ
MKTLLFGTLLLALVFVLPLPTMARVDVSVGISLPPIVFAAPPALIVLPGTYVYVVPDYDEDIFFYGGWWWRPWEGRWYRSHYYNRGWSYYRNVPSFYFDVDPGWRGYYRERSWYGHRWDYERIPERRVKQNWKSWNSNRHWERQSTWGVQNYQPPPQKQRQELRKQRQQQYQQRPEVRQQRQPNVLQQQQKQHQVRDAAKQQSRDIQKPQPRPQAQTFKPQVREAAKPQQSRDIQQKQSRPQSQPVKQQVRKAAKQQQSKPQEGKPERGQGEKQDRR